MPAPVIGPQCVAVFPMLHVQFDPGFSPVASTSATSSATDGSVTTAGTAAATDTGTGTATGTATGVGVAATAVELTTAEVGAFAAAPVITAVVMAGKSR